VVTTLGAGQFTFEVVGRAGPDSPAARVLAFAHMGKTRAFNDSRRSFAFGDVRVAHVGKTRLVRPHERPGARMPFSPRNSLR